LKTTLGTSIYEPKHPTLLTFCLWHCLFDVFQHKNYYAH